MATPFRIGEQVTGEFFTDRAEEVSRILRAMRDPTRLLVYGERRQGKSSAIRQAGLRFAEDGGLLIWVDVATASGLGDVARRVVSSIPYRWIWREDLQSRLVRASLRVEARTDAAGQPVLSLALGSRGAPDARDELERAVRVLDELAGDREIAVAIVLDEFQEVAEIAERGAWIVRDLMQTTHRTSWICAGSRTALIRDLTAADGPFHRFFEPLNVREIDPDHLASWIESRMASAGADVEEGAGHAILARVGPRTQDCLQLARAVYALSAARGEVRTADVESALRQSVLEDNDRFQTIWSGLAPSQQAVLRAVAAGVEHLYSQGAAHAYGLPTAGSVRKAVLALAARGHVTTGDETRVDDPFFREWILLKAMPDGVPHGELAR